MNAKIYSVESPKWITHLYDELLFEKDDREFTPPESYIYDSMSFVELVTQAKYDPAAFGELVCRMAVNIRKMVASFCNRNPNLDFDDCYFRMLVLLKKAIAIYDPKKGDFLHLFRKMYKKNMTWMGWKETVRYQRESEILGKRVSYVEAIALLSDSNNEENVFRNRATSIDLREYISKLSMRKKEIFTLYLNNYSVQQICEIVQEPYSTVYTMVRNLVNEFKEFIGESHKE